MLKEIPYDHKKLIGLKYHHTAARREYISRKLAGKMCEYSGRFGEGIAVLTPRFDTPNYCDIHYYIKEED